MIRIIDGDLMKAEEDIIGHQVNCQGKMGSGVAKQVKELFPYVFQRYLAILADADAHGYPTNEMLGRVQFVCRQDQVRGYIANLFGQDRYGYDGKAYTDTEKLRNCFRKLRQFAEAGGFSVALPYRIGSDRGGAEWRTVERLLMEEFEGYEVTLYRWKGGR